jgi:hypothetical protein
VSRGTWRGKLENTRTSGADRPDGVRRLRAIQRRSGHARTGCHAASNRAAASYREANPYNNANHASFYQTNRHTNSRSDDHTQPGRNR